MPPLSAVTTERVAHATPCRSSPPSVYDAEWGELRQGVAWATRSVVTALKGGIPDNVYNREVLPRWKERFGGASVTGS